MLDEIKAISAQLGLGFGLSLAITTTNYSQGVSDELANICFVTDRLGQVLCIPGGS